jgi:hypothetical protein
VTLAVQRLREASGGRLQRVLLIDLDAHQVRAARRPATQLAGAPAAAAAAAPRQPGGAGPHAA